MNNHATEGFSFRLFVAGNQPHSQRAEDNLRKLCGSLIPEPFEIEIVDVFEKYEIALENKILLTPALLVVSPAPAVVIFGDLNNTQEVLRALGLGGA